MDLELLGSLGWREGLIAIIALLVLYIIVLFLRMRRLQRGVAALPLAAKSAVAAYHAIQEPEPVVQVPDDSAPPAGPLPTHAATESPAPVESPKPDFPWNEPPPELPEQAMIDSLKRELYQLGCEVDDLRAQVLAVREDVRRQLAESTGPAQDASPLYNDAMQMALQGHEATTIAHHCGIARAEADLVVALARNRREGV
jgi:hypothetical protein